MWWELRITVHQILACACACLFILVPKLKWFMHELLNRITWVIVLQFSAIFIYYTRNNIILNEINWTRKLALKPIDPSKRHPLSKLISSDVIKLNDELISYFYDFCKYYYKCANNNSCNNIELQYLMMHIVFRIFFGEKNLFIFSLSLWICFCYTCIHTSLARSMHSLFLFTEPASS